MLIRVSLSRLRGARLDVKPSMGFLSTGHCGAPGRLCQMAFLISLSHLYVHTTLQQLSLHLPADHAISPANPSAKCLYNLLIKGKVFP